MLDVRLITLLPPAPPVAQTAAPSIAQPSAAGSVTTQGAALALPQLPAGSVLAGFIINRDAAGNPILRTDKGDIAFASNFFLKIGSEVVIRIQNSAGHSNAHIVTVNGQPPEEAALQANFNSEPDVVIGKQQQAAPQPPPANNTAPKTESPASLPSPLAPGKTISAIIIIPANPTPNAPTSSTAPAPQILSPGTSLLLDVLSGNPARPAPANPNSALAQLTPDAAAQAPEAKSTNALSSLLPQASATAAPQTAQTQPASPLSQILPNLAPMTSQPATVIPTPANVITTAPAAPAVQSSAPPTAPNPTAPAQAPAPANAPIADFPEASAIGQAAPFALSNQQAADAKLTGPLGQTIILTALKQNDDGSVTFNSPLGVLRAANIGTVPQGQQFALRVSSVATPNNYTITVANNAPPAPLETLPQLSRTWPSLQQITQIIGEQSAARIIPTFSNFAAPVANIAPENMPQAGGQIMFFLAALKGGSFKDWLGSQNVKALEDKGYGSLIKKAEGEFMQMARQFNETQPNNWQSAYFPVIASGELSQVRAFIKREKKKNEDGKPTGEEDTRFVLEMELSQLGEMQLDGLVKRRETTLQFDLVVRSMHPLPSELEKDIQQIYTSTAELTGYRGQIMFQSVQAFPVHPMEDTTPHVFDDVVV